MSIRIPEQPRFAHPTEELVWRALVDQLGPNDLVVANQRVTDHDKDHEIDFVVALEGYGVICLEVKGGEVWCEDGNWYQHHRSGPAIIEPVEQVRGAMYALRRFVDKDPRWTSGHVRWDHVVVFPNSAFSAEFALPDCPRWKVVDRDDVEKIASILMRVLVDQQVAKTGIDADGIAELAEVLSGRGMPQRDVVARALENEDTCDVLTAQQAVILDATRLLPRVEVRGGAGSGKTFLALEKARRLTRQGKRVALICYSHGLASYLERITATWPRKHRPAYVGEFHELGRKWGAPEGPPESLRTEQTVQFWEHDLPARMAELAAELPDKQRFDAVVVDEAQDFADDWWRPVLAALRDEDEGEIYVFSDEGQRVFDREGVPPVDLVPLVLDQNMRNTKQIAGSFVPLVGQRMRLLGGDGPDVRFVPCSPDDALDRADDAIDELLDEGWRPEDVALLATGSRHPEQIERQEAGPKAYWESFWDTDQVFYGHVLGFKGLERRAVVLALNEKRPQDRSRERLYVGLSRARDQLIVCGDPDFIREVGGEDLLERFGGA
ncbi:NERD domain-containing protein [Rhodococcus pyridinivorans]|nr:NERD domain-containing protein [Rhodococcus pyridinivorans]